MNILQIAGELTEHGFKCEIEKWDFYENDIRVIATSEEINDVSIQLTELEGKWVFLVYDPYGYDEENEYKPFTDTKTILDAYRLTLIAVFDIPDATNMSLEECLTQAKLIEAKWYADSHTEGFIDLLATYDVTMKNVRQKLCYEDREKRMDELIAQAQA